MVKILFVPCGKNGPHCNEFVVFCLLLIYDGTFESMIYMRLERLEYEFSLPETDRGKNRCLFCK